MSHTNPPADPHTPPVNILALSEKLNITEEDVYLAAVTISGSESSAKVFLDRPNPLLQNRTPREAVQAGEGRRLMGMLLNAAGV